MKVFELMNVLCTGQRVLISAVAQYLLQENKSMRFAYKGKKYKLCVVEAEEAQT